MYSISLLPASLTILRSLTVNEGILTIMPRIHMTKIQANVPSFVERSLPEPVINCQRSMAIVAILKAVTMTIVVCRPGPSLQRTRPRFQLISMYLRRVSGAQIRHNKMSLSLVKF